MNFKDVLIQAKDGDQFAVDHIFQMYKPLIFKESVVEGIFDDDLYQELCLTLLNCIKKIKI